MARGRVQVEWRATTQTRANNQRTWLNGQLSGRGFIAEELPAARPSPQRGGFVTVCNVAFDTTQDGSTIRTLCLSRQSADSTIVAGSWTQYHECAHEEGQSICTAARTVK